MKKKKIIIQLAIATSLFNSCSNNGKGYDASGSFEAIERTISAEATGRILTLKIEEGQLLKKGEIIGSIDVSNLTIQSEQVQSSIMAINEKTDTPSAQIMVLLAQLKTQKSQVATVKQQLTNVNKEVIRFKNLAKADAVPQKQLDDLTGKKLVLEKQLETTQAQAGVIQSQIDAATINTNTHNKAILSEVDPNEKKLKLIEKHIQDGTIINEYPGTVTTQIAYDGEFTSVGRPLYRIADLSSIILRVYVTGNQLPKIKLNQEVTVKTDDGNGGFKENKGTISWISSKAEFTPKTIQTKDERANLVYAIKVKVNNDGSYKIGMYGEVSF